MAYDDGGFKPHVRRPVDPDELYRRMVQALLGPNSFNANREYTSHSQRVSIFRDVYLLKEFLRKYPDTKSGVDTRTVAINSMVEREKKNAEANDRIYNRDYGEDPRVREVYYLACRKAITALGRFSSKRFRDGLRHGPGSTVRLKGLKSSLEHKLAGKPTVTAKASELGYLVLTESPMWAYNISNEISPQTVLTIEDCEQVTTVPKNAETDRIIAIQPDLNIYCQLAVGYCIRHALEKVGVNLNDQTINQRRAREGSLTGNLATVDLTSASDSITWQLVWDFIGNWSDLDGSVDRTWWRVMDALRCETGMVDGNIFTWERFSAMGNGYTFELESLIFWALTVSACEVLGIPPDVSVYGDDVICPVEVVPLLTQVFAFCGLELNTRKSHADLPPFSFRESCGKHYVDGIDVTPFYVRQPLTEAAEVLLLANNISRWAVYPDGYGRDQRLKPVWDWVVSHLSTEAYKSAIPFGEDDDGLIKSFDEAHPSVVYARGPMQFYHYEGPGVWVLNDSGVLVQQVDRISSEKHFPPMRIGYKCSTLERVWGGRSLSDDEAYLVWHYNKSFKRFSPTDYSSAPWLKSLEVDPYRRCEGKTFKYRYRAGRRITRIWKDCGPWI